MCTISSILLLLTLIGLNTVFILLSWIWLAVVLVVVSRVEFLSPILTVTTDIVMTFDESFETKTEVLEHTILIGSTHFNKNGRHF